MGDEGKADRLMTWWRSSWFSSPVPTWAGLVLGVLVCLAIAAGYYVGRH